MVVLFADVNDSASATDVVTKTLWTVASLGDANVLVVGTGGGAAAAEANKLWSAARLLFADDHAYRHGTAVSLGR